MTEQKSARLQELAQALEAAGYYTKVKDQALEVGKKGIGIGRLELLLLEGVSDLICQFPGMCVTHNGNSLQVVMIDLDPGDLRPMATHARQMERTNRQFKTQQRALRGAAGHPLRKSPRPAQTKPKQRLPAHARRPAATLRRYGRRVGRLDKQAVKAAARQKRALADYQARRDARQTEEFNSADQERRRAAHHVSDMNRRLEILERRCGDFFPGRLRFSVIPDTGRGEIDITQYGAVAHLRVKSIGPGLWRVRMALGTNKEDQRAGPMVNGWQDSTWKKTPTQLTDDELEAGVTAWAEVIRDANGITEAYPAPLTS